MRYTTKSPIVLIIYKRPDLTRKVLACIKMVRPNKLFVIADGPKTDKELELCQQTRNIIKQVDWPCEVKTNFVEQNMGLRNRVVSGLNWIFLQVDRAIILEDDCIADPTFFKYCDQLLTKYHDNKRVTTISGNNFLFGKLKTDNSYYFSKYPLIWGWATWKRAWHTYDDNLRKWPEQKKSNNLSHILHHPDIINYWTYIFDKVYTGTIDSWAYRWTYSNLFDDGITIIPNKNLVTNIGYGQGSTHTFLKSKRMGMDIEPMTFPLSHPNNIRVNQKADRITEKTTFVTLQNRIINIIKRVLRA